MSVHAAAPMASEWPNYRINSRPMTTLSGEQEEIGLGLGFGRIQTSTVERPPSRSHKSFTSSLTGSNFSTTHSQMSASQTATSSNRNESSPYLDRDHKISSNGSQSVPNAFGGSAPVSPVPQLTPTSADGDLDEHPDDDEDMIVVGGEEEEDEACSNLENGSVEKTAAERRAEKRKMKRFRLTHNQTRFLMSEFARQAHPDAAQRERLSREIPGLSPRQVQVWFQNRRAKLKRLTTDDRERMMKSRALPEDFDMTQALHSPFGASISQSISQNYSTPMISPANYSSAFADNGSIRPPLIMSGLRRDCEDDSTMSPIMSSNFNSYFTSSGSLSATENLSPISPSGNRAPFMNSGYSQSSTPRSSNPFTRSNSFNSSLHPNVPRLHLPHDRVSRSRADSLSSPLRTSTSYGGHSDFGTSTASEESLNATAGAGFHTPRSYSNDTSLMSRQTGFSYLPHGFQSSALARTRSNATSFPPGLDLRQSYPRPLLPFNSLSHQQISTQPQTSHPQPLNVAHTHHAAMSQHNSPVSHQGQGPQSPYHSLAYSSAPLVPPPDFQLPTSNGIYGVSYADSDTDVNHLNMGINSAPNTSTIPGNPIEPENYYKSEPENRRMGVPQHRTPSNQYSPSRRPQSSQAHTSYGLHSPAPSTPQTPGMKRGSDGEVGHGQNDHKNALTPELGTYPRRKSFPLPSGYGTAVGSVGGGG